VITRVDPVLTEHRFNPVPVRIIIDKEGKVKHIHFLSAFPDQAKVITDALNQWKFKRYMRGGKPAEVENWNHVWAGIPSYGTARQATRRPMTQPDISKTNSATDWPCCPAQKLWVLCASQRNRTPNSM